MTVLIQQNQLNPVLTDGGMLSNGWVTTDVHVDTQASSLANNLPSAARRAEQLMEALEDELSVKVSVSYMRVETDALFHVLMLICKEDFLSSKIQAARVISERFARAGNSYDIRFSFAIESENMMENIIKFHGYRLLHVK